MSVQILHTLYHMCIPVHTQTECVHK